MTGVLPTANYLAILLRLIDDETPEVRASVSSALQAFNGDVSELLADTGIPLSPKERQVLTKILLPARRKTLRHEWIVPGDGISAFNDDWDGLEGRLRELSDYLHDGLTLRQPLGDALDLLADECESAVVEHGSLGIVTTLLHSGRLQPDPHREINPNHYDLAKVIAGGPTNDLGLGLVLLLVGQRLGADISGINLPGVFFCRLESGKDSILIDPTVKKPIDPGEFIHRIRRFPPEIRARAVRPATPGELLLRTVEELATAFAVIDENEDAELIEELIDSLTQSG